MTKIFWRIGFLGITALAVVLELIAVLDSNEDTEPWTSLIVGYIPIEVAVVVFGALLAWLPVHFYFAYRRNRKE